MGLHALAGFDKNKAICLTVVSYAYSACSSWAMPYQIRPSILLGKFLLNLNFFKARPHTFKFGGLLLTFLVFTLQCTWTPEVETIIHRDTEGLVTLQTSEKFKISPHHPQILSELQVKQVLRGISQKQEQGILQELFISDSKQTPIFSPTQIEFLTPHLIEAIAQATSEELIMFQHFGDKERANSIRGTVTLFSPNVFLLTLKRSENSTKMSSSSRSLHQHLTLTFGQEKAMLSQEDGQRFMKIPPKDPWIALNLKTLTSEAEFQTNQEGKNHQNPIIPAHHEHDSPQTLSLEEQLQDLRKKVDEQDKEIRRLQKSTPK